MGDGSSAATNLEVNRDTALISARLNGSSCTKRAPSELTKPKITVTCQDGDQRWPVECCVCERGMGQSWIT